MIGHAQHCLCWNRRVVISYPLPISSWIKYCISNTPCTYLQFIGVMPSTPYSTNCFARSFFSFFGLVAHVVSLACFTQILDMCLVALIRTMFIIYYEVWSIYSKTMSRFQSKHLRYEFCIHHRLLWLLRHRPIQQKTSKLSGLLHFQLSCQLFFEENKFKTGDSFVNVSVHGTSINFVITMKFMNLLMSYRRPTHDRNELTDLRWLL